MIIETGPREIGLVLWGHCQNLLDDPRNKRNVWVILSICIGSTMASLLDNVISTQISCVVSLLYEPVHEIANNVAF